MVVLQNGGDSSLDRPREIVMKNKKEIADILEGTISNELTVLKHSDTSVLEKLDEILHCLRLSGENVIRVGDVFLDEMKKGMRDEPSSLLMENTYLPEVMTGDGNGEYMALDLGGTNFRVLLVKIRNGRVVDELFETYDMDHETRHGCGTKLFDYLAECVADFAQKQGIADKALKMGFTFSFPMHQRSLHSAILTKWTKSFSASDVEGRDVVTMLQEALERQGKIRVNVNAILNDTTGTLLQGCALDSRTRIGLILGTGSNAAYIEKAENVTHWETERHGEKENAEDGGGEYHGKTVCDTNNNFQIVIDIEWGAFGDNGAIDFIKTHFDRQLDNNSLFINSFSFEKYISGHYLGELARIVVVHLANNRLLFNGVLSKEIQVKDSFPTKYVSKIEQDNVDDSTEATELILDEFNLAYTNDDVAIIQYVCELISLRATLLISTCLATLLRRMDKRDVTIAIDGSLYKYHPRFKGWMETFTKVLAPNHKFQLLLAEDGSGKGAGIASAIAERLELSYAH